MWKPKIKIGGERNLFPLLNPSGQFSFLIPIPIHPDHFPYCAGSLDILRWQTESKDPFSGVAGELSLKEGLPSEGNYPTLSIP